MDLPFLKLHPDAVMPRYSSDEAACVDFFCVAGLHGLPDPPPFDRAVLDSWVMAEERGHYILEPGALQVVRTGVAMAIPAGFTCKLEERSSQARSQLYVHGGRIDADYRGEWFVLLQNHGRFSHTLMIGDRVCQGLYTSKVRVSYVPVDVLPATSRGAGGFGSTGK